MGTELTPTVEQVAAGAGISRAAAYRYFPSHGSCSRLPSPEIGATSLLPDDPPDRTHEAVRRVVRRFTELILRPLRSNGPCCGCRWQDQPSRAGALPLRQGRAIGWIEGALRQCAASCPTAHCTTSVLAIRSAAGIEALVSLTDVAGLSSGGAARLMSWSAQAMLHAALTQSRGHLVELTAEGRPDPGLITVEYMPELDCGTTPYRDLLLSLFIVGPGQ